MMEAYHDLNDEPVVSSSLLLRTMLRTQLNFEGVLLTDWAEIRNLHSYHHVAESLEKVKQLFPLSLQWFAGQHTGICAARLLLRCRTSISWHAEHATFSRVNRPVSPISHLAFLASGR